MPTLDETPTEALLEGRYRLGECIGRGGMAVVHRAEDLMLDRTVAIKIMRSGTEGPGAGARTRREMSVLASLNHPGLVTLLDARVVEGGPEYLVMEYVDGPSLRERLDEGPLTPTEVASLAGDLAEALHAVHSAGVVHRDIKPSNVLLAPTGFPSHPFRAKLADFGIAQLLDGARMTSPGMVLGTPAYVAPEQARGAAPAPAADIFALGVVLLEAFTGKRPFSNATPAEAIAARQTLPPDIPDGLDPRWAALLRRMTSLDPVLRPTALEVASAVRPLRPEGDTQPWSGGSAAPGAAAGASLVSANSSEVTAGGDDGGTRTLVMPPVPTANARPRRAGGRLRVLAALGTGSAAALIAAVVWASSLGDGTPEPVSSVPPVVAPSAPVEQAPAVDTSDDDSQEDGGEQDDDAPQQNEKEAAKAAEEQAKQAEKAAEEQRKKAEEAQKQAEKAAEEKQKSGKGNGGG
ncbi:serine/threonine-protein kinase [Microbacterium sp.]|uniref:serine/threonine-protein kinase n=1 Tax=Microbacterium sp. TaxID=51671 RepID=UPI002812061D|nr:serine/threonine-protein kinase [Microbacterium sp.]